MLEPYAELKRPDTDPEIIEGLVQAIVLQAVKDIKSKLYLSKKASPWIRNVAERNRSDAIWFFTSQWFYELTEMNGEWLLQQILKEEEE